jgi:CRP/FNR family transcriptional regulator/CRP/FNR family cyclic AMP-dependent transcriptional regulator
MRDGAAVTRHDETQQPAQQRPPDSTPERRPGIAPAAARAPQPRRVSTATAPRAKTPAETTGKPASSGATPFVRVPLFANLDADSLRELAAVTRRRSYQAGEIIFHRDDPGQVLFVLREGKVRIYVTSPDGQEVTLAVLAPGDYFGELALLDGHPRSASAITLEPVEVYALRRADFINAVMQHPRIAIEVMTVLSRRLRDTDRMVEDLLFLDVHGRVAKKLLDLAAQHGVETADGILIDMRLTQADLAALVGSSRESVNKVIGYFLDKRFISTEKRKITILRHADLRRHVG